MQLPAPWRRRLATGGTQMLRAFRHATAAVLTLLLATVTSVVAVAPAASAAELSYWIRDLRAPVSGYMIVTATPLSATAQVPRDIGELVVSNSPREAAGVMCFRASCAWSTAYDSRRAQPFSNGRVPWFTAGDSYNVNTIREYGLGIEPGNNVADKRDFLEKPVSSLVTNWDFCPMSGRGMYDPATPREECQYRLRVEFVKATVPPIEVEPSPAPSPSPSTTPSQPTTPQPTTKTVVTPTLRNVGYINSFDPRPCQDNIKATNTLPDAAAITCAAINATANPVPAANIASSDVRWQNFIASKEYRMIAALPSYTMKCDKGKIVEPPASYDKAFRNFGYTPFRLPNPDLYFPGDPFQKNPWSRDEPTISVFPSGETASIEYKVAARAPLPESLGNRGISTDILPFVWMSIQEQVSCDGGIAFRVDSSNTPTKAMYVNGRLTTTQAQTSDWGAFLSNGVKYNSPKKFFSGHGIMDPNCSRTTFSGYPDGTPVRSRPLSYDSCKAITG